MRQLLYTYQCMIVDLAVDTFGLHLTQKLADLLVRVLRRAVLRERHQRGTRVDDEPSGSSA